MDTTRSALSLPNPNQIWGFHQGGGTGVERARVSATPPRMKHDVMDVAAAGPNGPTNCFPWPQTTPPAAHQHKI